MHKLEWLTPQADRTLLTLFPVITGIGPSMCVNTIIAGPLQISIIANVGWILKLLDVELYLQEGRAVGDGEGDAEWVAEVRILS